MQVSVVMWDTYWNRYKQEFPGDYGWKKEVLPTVTKDAYKLFDVMIEEFRSEGLETTAKTFEYMKKEFFKAWQKEIES